MNRNIHGIDCQIEQMNRNIHGIREVQGPSGELWGKGGSFWNFGALGRLWGGSGEPPGSLSAPGAVLNPERTTFPQFLTFG